MSETAHKNVHMALAAAQGQMGRAVKGSVNLHFKSKYADLADVMQAVLPALNEAGIAAWHSTVHADGTMYMRTTLSHGETDTHMQCDIPLLVGKNDMQGMKSATTYAKRIGIESLTGVAPEDDDGNAAAASRKAAPQAISDDAAATLKQRIADLDVNTGAILDAVADRLRIPRPESIDALPASAGEWVASMLARKEAEAKG